MRCKRTGGSGHVAKRSAAGGGKKSDKTADLQPKHEAPLENLTRGAQRGGAETEIDARSNEGQLWRDAIPPAPLSPTLPITGRPLPSPNPPDAALPGPLLTPFPSGRPSSVPRRPPVPRGEVDNTFDPSPFPLTPFISGPMRHRPAVLAAHATSHALPTSGRKSFCIGRRIHTRSFQRSAPYGNYIPSGGRMVPSSCVVSPWAPVVVGNGNIIFSISKQ